MHVDRVPATGPALLVANHQSYLDPPFIGCLIGTRNLDYIARVGLFVGPLGWLIRALSSIPVKGTGADKGTIKEVAARLKLGRATLIFPEGSRTDDGYLQPFAGGAALLARLAQCSIVPIAIAGAYEAWPRWRRVPIPWKSRVRVMYGEVIPFESLRGMDAEAVSALLRERIAAMLHEMGERVERPEGEASAKFAGKGSEAAS